MEENTTTAAVAPPLYGGGGGGGKIKKHSSRKPATTPYARPPTAAANRPGGGWLSRIVDPAYRFISGGATKIMPSFFSKASPVVPPLLPITNSIDSEDEEEMPSTKDEEKCTSSSVVFGSTERKDPNQPLDEDKRISQDDKLGQEIPGNSQDDSEISKIEQLMKGKTFSREEILHLTEILKSKVTDELENNKPSITAGRDTEGVLSFDGTPRRLSERKQEEANRALLGSITPLPQTIVKDAVGASPIDLARAYMGSRKSDQIPGSHSFLTNDKQEPENAYKSYLPPPSPKPSPCWPGTMVEKQGYATPQNQRSRFGLHDFPRTPYSRTLLSKSRTSDSRGLDLSVKTSQQSQTSTFGQVRTNNDVFDRSYGSVGPIRRIRNKLGSEPRSRKSIFLNPSKAASSIEQSLGPKPFLPALGNNKEIDDIIGTSKSNTVEHSTYTYEKALPTESTRIILDHFNRHKPTPKEKADELKLATSWKRSSAEVSDARPNGSVSLLPSTESRVLKTTELETEKSSKDVDNEKAIIQINSGDSSLGAAKATTDANLGTPDPKINTNAGPSLFSKNTHTIFKSFPHEKDSIATTQNWSFQQQSNGQSFSTIFNSSSSKPAKELPANTSGTKPTLSSIAINKPDFKRAAASDNGFGFTFPVPASSGALSEPPTPSMPSSATKVASHTEEQPSAVPSFSFGAERSSQRLVFAFPSTNSASVHTDNSDIKFDFGANGKSRLNFSAVGKASC